LTSEEANFYLQNGIKVNEEETSSTPLPEFVTQREESQRDMRKRGSPNCYVS
jgi:hypothetical protein